MKLYIILIFIMAIIDVFVLGLMKYQLSNYNPYYFLIAFIFYGLQPIIFYYSIKYGGNLSINNVLWDLMSDILVILVGFYIFKEYLTDSQIIGILLGILSIYILTK